MNLTMNSGSQLSRMLYQSYLVPVLSLAGCYPLMQVRWVDQTQYPMIVVASLSAVPQSCRTPLPLLKFKLKPLLKFRLKTKRS